ncbi:MAG: hypothetical protein NTZ78_10335 [Candidatus Aureabacteria bacterium]|nr:hypothetical protein [Candidatus Auribacterota bacterium]
MRKLLLKSAAVAQAALLISLLCIPAVRAQEGGAGAPAPAMSPAAVKAPAAPMQPVGVPGVPTKGSAVKQMQKPVKWGGCTSACPACLRTCELNVGHYGPHQCSQGHTWY